MSNRRALWAISAVLLCGGLTAGGLSQPAHAQAVKPKPKPKVKQLFPYWENYLRIPTAERSRFQLAYILQSGGKPMTDVQIFAVDGARRVPIAVAADGRMTPPPIEFFRSKSAVMDAPGAAGRQFNVNLQLLATAAPSREMNAAELTATLDQTNAGIRKAAGLLGVAAPKMGSVMFAGAGSGEAVDAQGRRTPLPLLKGTPYFQPAALPNAQRVVLARAPTKMTLGPAVKAERGS